MSDDEALYRTWRWAIAENIVTVIVSGAAGVGLYALGAGGWSALALLGLLNINQRIRVRGGDDDAAP